jgi:hypothetical protein
LHFDVECPFLTDLRVWPVFSFLIVTAALGTAAFVASVMVPVILPVSVWPYSIEDNAAPRSVKRKFRIFMFSSQLIEHGLHFYYDPFKKSHLAGELVWKTSGLPNW